MRVLIVSMSLCMFLISCKREDPPSPAVKSSAITLSSSDCKGIIGDTRSGKEDAIEYVYDDNNTLWITHINAAFNCCASIFTAHPEINNGQPGTSKRWNCFGAYQTIIIEEKENEAPCECNCLYDWKYKITNISPGTYTLKIIEPYVNANSIQLVYAIDLNEPTSGKFGVVRTSYPWGS